MFALRVVEHFYVIEDILTCLIARLIDPAADALAVKQVEETLGNRIVIAVPMGDQTMFQIMLTKESGPVDAGILGTLIRMSQPSISMLSLLDGHQQF